jgi:hypothetical protein
MLREHYDSDVWMARPDFVCRIDALHVVARRHPDVRDDGVRQQAIDCVDELLRRTDCGHDLDRAGVFEQSPGALPNQVVVLRDDDP